MLPFGDVAVLAQDDRAHAVLFQVQGDAERGRLARVDGRELQQLAGHRLGEPVDAGNPVAYLDHRAHVGGAHRRLGVLDLVAQRPNDVFGSDAHRR